MYEMNNGPKGPDRPLLDWNKQRRQIAVQISPAGASVALNFIPLLFHYNHASMPCYIESPDGAGGIEVFELTDDMRQTAASLLPDYKGIEKDINWWRPKKCLIESLLLMGSVGSSAQNAASDYDYWLMIDRKKLTEAEVRYLETKLAAVEKWADEKQKIEVHFFLTDLNMVQANDFGSVDKESAGSSQARLLKEEFYRTCIHVAGKYPAWWLTPPGATDAEYAATLKKLAASYEVDMKRYIDLGNVSEISPGEIFGAALWQINKALSAPFKSLIKIALLDSFIDPDGNKMLLCDELKRNILAKSSAPAQVDPYLIMIKRILDFYARKDRKEVVDLLRKCFYNKVKVKVTPALRKKAQPSFKEDAMLRFVAEWKWDDATTANLNDYENWNFDAMTKMGSELHGALIEIYKRVTDTLKTNEDVKSRLTDADLTVLGRKIFSFYKKKPGKIDFVKKASDDALRQESVTFMPVVQMGKKPVWTVYRGNVSTDVARKVNVEHTAIRKSQSLAELICWLTMNQVIDSGTFLHLIPNPLPVHLKTIQDLVKLINEFAPPRSISAIGNAELLKSEKITDLLVIANFVSQPWAKFIEEVALLYRNNHGENFCEALDGKGGSERIAEIGAQIGPSINPNAVFRMVVPRSENSAKFEKLIRAQFSSKFQ